MENDPHLVALYKRRAELQRLIAEGDDMKRLNSLPPPMTPQQFIALLDEFCILSLAKRTRRLVDNRSRYETFYTLSLTDIYEADALLSGPVIDEPNSAAER
jgi:hypothetical protein